MASTERIWIGRQETFGTQETDDLDLDSILVPKRTAPTIATVPAPPDGGFTAWVQCAGAFILFFNCWGVVNSFGTRRYTFRGVCA